MADIIQQRRDTAARWAQYNPILLEGEVGYVTDNPNQYKIGNGVSRWNDLPLRGYTGTIAQNTGNDENAVMSQKAVTEKLSELGSLTNKYILNMEGVSESLYNIKCKLKEGFNYILSVEVNDVNAQIEIRDDKDNRIALLGNVSGKLVTEEHYIPQHDVESVAFYANSSFAYFRIENADLSNVNLANNINLLRKTLEPLDKDAESNNLAGKGISKMEFAEKEGELDINIDGLYKVGAVLHWDISDVIERDMANYIFRKDGSYITLSSDKKGALTLYDDGFSFFRTYAVGHMGAVGNRVLNVNIENEPNSAEIIFSKTFSIESLSEKYIDVPVSAIKPNTLVTYTINDSIEESYLIYLMLADDSYIYVHTVGNGQYQLTMPKTNKGIQYMRFYRHGIGASTLSVVLSYANNNYINSLKDDVETMKKQLSISNENLSMCLPRKLFACKGLASSIFKDSITMTPNVPNDMYYYPITYTNFQCDNVQIGKAVKLDNLDGCEKVRLGIRTNDAKKIIFKDIEVVYRNAEGLIRTACVIGDSITNRGAAKFAQLAANSIGCTINTIGTMVNSGVKGEGREGWTWAMYIGAQTLHGDGNRINVMSDGVNGNLYSNPFVRIANDNDKLLYPEWCFPNTGKNREVSYKDEKDESKVYYIFDFRHYLNRWEGTVNLDVVSIALGTNDILNNIYTMDEIVSQAKWVVDSIVRAVPDINIGLLPNPGWGASWYLPENVIPYVETMKETFKNYEQVDIIGLWCYIDRFLDFGITSVVSDNPSTDIGLYADNIHFDTADGGKKSYLTYGKVLASYILNTPPSREV